MADSDWNYGSADLEDLILSLNWSQELQKKNLEYLDDHLDSWKMRQRAELMERLGSSRTEIVEYGDTEAKALATYWYGHHKNRPAMKDELKKAGYPQK